MNIKEDATTVYEETILIDVISQGNKRLPEPHLGIFSLIFKVK